MGVRAATVDDARAIASVHVRGWRAAYEGLLPQDLLDAIDEDRRRARWEQIIDRAGPTECTWVHEHDGEVRAFASAGASRDEDAHPSRTGELFALYAVREAWRTGTGSALNAQVLDHLRAHGFADATLWVLTGNARGRAFYDARGWAPDGATKDEAWNGETLTEVRYRIEL